MKYMHLLITNREKCRCPEQETVRSLQLEEQAADSGTLLGTDGLCTPNQLQGTSFSYVLSARQMCLGSAFRHTWFHLLLSTHVTTPYTKIKKTTGIKIVVL